MKNSRTKGITEIYTQYVKKTLIKSPQKGSQLHRT